MRNFYITYDYSKVEVQIAASIYAPNVTVKIVANPSPSSNRLSTGAIIGISVGGFVFLVIIVVVVVALQKCK